MKNHSLPNKRVFSLILCAAACALPSQVSAQTSYTYLALGDSVGFGITNGASYFSFSNGDRGYVSRYADWQATQNAGLRPTVRNISVFGDSSASFLDVSNPARVLNTNYPTPPAPPQSQFAFVSTQIAAAAAAGRPVQRVTVSLGANDLLSLVQQPGFISLPPDQQAAVLFGAVGTLQTNLGNLYGALRTALPTAEIIAVGYYDPFIILPGNPNPALTTNVILTVNSIIEQTSSFFGGRYVDVYSAFSGREQFLTNMLLDTTTPEPNVHPTEAGYEVIAMQIIPAPSAAGLVLAGVVALSHRRRRASPLASMKRQLATVKQPLATVKQPVGQ